MITDDLLFRFIEGTTAPKENHAVNLWLQMDPANSAKLERLKILWLAEEDGDPSEETQRAWKSLETRILLNSTPASKPEIRSIIGKLSIAATLLILVASGVILILSSRYQKVVNRNLITESFTLPDGSHVDLGPDSKIRFSKTMDKGDRIVSLKGDAFFDVSAGSEHPFIVKTGKANIQVTGTKFIVNASRNRDEVEVAVRSGQVLFYNSLIMSKNAYKMDLGPGEMGIYSAAKNRMDKTRDPNYDLNP
jgi:ferric-dicitrate binding protein FerR (iron transport regulator)